MLHKRPPCGYCTHRNYNLACDEFDELFADHAGRCAPGRCTGPESKRGVLCIDHDWRYGDWAVRGLLCSRCNTGLELRLNRTPAEEAYLADPWWRRYFLRLSLPVDVPPEPAVGAIVVVGQERWKRTERGWVGDPRWPTPWRTLTVRHAPYEFCAVPR